MLDNEISQITIFVSCPSDVEDEKQIVKDLCDSINNGLMRSKIKFNVIDWRENVPHIITGEPTQAIINREIEAYNYDVFFGILWKRFGDKQSNGLTPTEEEFERAFKMQQETGKPIIRVNFLKKVLYPRDQKEALQLAEILRFKEHLIGLNVGFYEECEDKKGFQYKTNEFLLSVFDKIQSINDLKITINKNQFSLDLFYLQRKVIKHKDYRFPESLYFTKEGKDIIDEIKITKKIVLLGDAGTGKTIELKRVAAVYSRPDLPLYPYLLYLNKYVNQSLSQLLPQGWDKIPENQLLLILDGLDEIESKNKNNAIRSIELFAEQHPESHIIVSCRSNFYKAETEEISATLNDFTSYILLELNETEINKYLEDQLKTAVDVFKDYTYKNQLIDFLKIPFYLIHLVELFKNKGTFPKNKADIFNSLISARIKLDIKHFRSTIELDEKRDLIIKIIQRVALVMECLGRNYISANEYEEILPESNLRNLLKFCTAWQKREGEEITWQFEHNNIQEYLAATALSDKPLDEIKDFLAFKPDHKKIMPSWVNTLSFLVSLYRNSKLLDWLMEIEPELAVKFEPDKLNRTQRVKIFKDIFNYYKTKKIWIDRDKYRYEELAEFGQVDENIELLLNEIEAENHYTTIVNAIDLLGYMKIPYKYKQRCLEVLIKFATDKQKSGHVQNRALLALTNLKMNTKEVIENLISFLRTSQNDWVRYGLYYLIYESDFLDNYIEVFLEGIELIVSDYSTVVNTSRIGNERWILEKALEKVEKPHSIKMIFKYFIKKPKCLQTSYMEESLSAICEHAAKIYHENPEILELTIDLLLVFIKENIDKEIKYLTKFFDKTETRFEAFKKVLLNNQLGKEKILALGELADSEGIAFIIKEYQEGRFNEDDVWRFQNSLRLGKNDLFFRFNREINEISGNKFIVIPIRNYDEERKRRNQSDFNLLFDKEVFLNQIKLIFDTENKEKFDTETLDEIRDRCWDNPYYSNLVMWTLRELVASGFLSFNKIKKQFKATWEWFSISKIYEKLSSSQELAITNTQKEYIVNWCNKNINTIDFKTALITEENRKFSCSWVAIYLWFFLIKLELNYPKKVLLDMISFDWIMKGEMFGILYLEKYLTRDEITQQIISNLNKGIKNEDVLKNHIEYCKNHKLEEGLLFALDVIVDDNRNHQLRIISLKTVIELSNSTESVLHVLPKVTDDFKWEIIKGVIEFGDKRVEEHLLKIFTNAKEEDKLEASKYLIMLQNIKGLEYYVEWVKKHKKLPNHEFEKSPIINFNNISALPFLLELLKVSYDKDFIEDKFNRLENIVFDSLTSLAIESEENYIQVRERIKEFIKQNISVYDNINFLYIFLERLEQRFYVSKNTKISFQEVLAKIQQF